MNNVASRRTAAYRYRAVTAARPELHRADEIPLFQNFGDDLDRNPALADAPRHQGQFDLAQAGRGIFLGSSTLGSRSSSSIDCTRHSHFLHI